MSESASGNVPVENPQHASVPETPESPAGEDRAGTPERPGAVPPPGQEPKDDPDAEGEERFDAG